jgi:hypothetical protein
LEMQLFRGVEHGGIGKLEFISHLKLPLHSSILLLVS